MAAAAEMPNTPPRRMRGGPYNSRPTAQKKHNGVLIPHGLTLDGQESPGSHSVAASQITKQHAQADGESVGWSQYSIGSGASRSSRNKGGVIHTKKTSAYIEAVLLR